MPLGLSRDAPPGAPGSAQLNHIPITGNLIGVADAVVGVWRARIGSVEGLAVSPVPVKRHRCRLNLNGCAQQSDVEGLFVWAGPHHHGLFEDDEDFPAGVTVYTRAVRDKPGYLLVTDSGRAGC